VCARDVDEGAVKCSRMEMTAMGEDCDDMKKGGGVSVQRARSWSMGRRKLRV
jgi:hypothetical protein